MLSTQFLWGSASPQWLWTKNLLYRRYVVHSHCGDAEPHKNWVDSMIPCPFYVHFHHHAVHGLWRFCVGKVKLGQEASGKVINIID